MARRFKDLSFQLPSSQIIKYRDERGRFSKPDARRFISVELYHVTKRGVLKRDYASPVKRWTRESRDKVVLERAPKAKFEMRGEEQTQRQVKSTGDLEFDFRKMEGRNIRIHIQFKDREGNVLKRILNYHVGKGRVHLDEKGKLVSRGQTTQFINEIAFRDAIRQAVESMGFRVSANYLGRHLGKNWLQLPRAAAVAIRLEY